MALFEHPKRARRARLATSNVLASNYPLPTLTETRRHCRERMASTRGFDHLNVVLKSIHELYRAFGAEKLKSFASDFVLGTSADEVRTDPIIGTQHLARRIAGHYRLPVTTVIVSYSSSLLPPGRVELSQSNEFFVELQSQYSGDPKPVAAILAHEVAHILLYRCGVRFPDQFENEVLTDTTAVYLGFGPTILNAATETKNYLPNKVVQTRTHHFGYLSLDEFGYIQAKRDDLFGRNSDTSIDPGLPKSGFGFGRRRLNTERKKRPYAPPALPRVSSFIERVRKKLSPRPPQPARPQTGTSLTFPCACCSQDLRIPLLGKQLTVRCPVCDSRLTCYS